MSDAPEDILKGETFMTANMQKQQFKEWLRARIRLVGEELIRRSEELDFGGLDAVVAVDIDVHIPTLTDEIGWPSLSISFDCGEKKYLDALVSGEIAPPPSQEVYDES